MSALNPETNDAPCCAFEAPNGCKEVEMLDALMLVAGMAFFAIAIAYVTACDRM